MTMRPDVETTSLTEDFLDELWAEIIKELLDPKLTKWTHGNYRTYVKGCRGPVCSKGTRDYYHTKQPSSQKRARYAELDPIIDIFEEAGKRAILRAHAGILERLT